MWQTITAAIPPIHREGHRFVAIFAVVAILLGLLWSPLGWIGIALTVWCAAFFRDPVRVVPQIPGALISPADGVVQSIEKAAPPPELGMGDEKRVRIAIFMNVFNVHVNRTPADGEVTALHYRPGKFLNASLDKASIDNERQSVRLTTSEGQDIAVVQIAGLVARRILCDLIEGQKVEAGERIGLIRFGSRVDVYLDEGLEPQVLVGQQAVAGETVIADRAPRRREGVAR